jgi:hypothetical protein
MPLFGPGIREIQVDALYLFLLKITQNVLRFHADKPDVGEGLFLHFLNGTEQYAGILFDPHVIDLRVQSGQFHQKSAFSCSYFHMDRLIIPENLFPFSGASALFRNHIFAGADHLSGTGDISQSHSYLFLADRRYLSAALTLFKKLSRFYYLSYFTIFFKKIKLELIDF